MELCFLHVHTHTYLDIFAAKRWAVVLYYGGRVPWGATRCHVASFRFPCGGHAAAAAATVAAASMQQAV